MEADNIQAIIEALIAFFRPELERERAKARAEADFARRQAELSLDYKVLSTFQDAGYTIKDLEYSNGHITFKADNPISISTIPDNKAFLQLEGDLPNATLEAPIDSDNLADDLGLKEKKQ